MKLIIKFVFYSSFRSSKLLKFLKIEREHGFYDVDINLFVAQPVNEAMEVSFNRIEELVQEQTCITFHFTRAQIFNFFRH